jgi:ubiquitin C
MNNFNLNALHLPRFLDDFNPDAWKFHNFSWQRYGLPEPPAAVFSECVIKPSHHWIIILRHMQHVIFCTRVLHWNLRLQCNFQHYRSPPCALIRLPLYSLVSDAIAPNALSLTPPQQRKVLCFAGQTLLLLRLLMRHTASHSALDHQLYQTLRRINSGAVSVRLLEIGMTCVSITTAPSSGRVVSSLKATLSDTIGAVKANFLKTLTNNPTFINEWSSLIRFHFDGKHLLDHCSLAECGIKPNDTINMTMVEAGREAPRIFVRTPSGEVIVAEVQPADIVDKVKFIMWSKQGCPLSLIRLVFAGQELLDGRRLSDYNVPVNGTIHSVLRRTPGL